MPKQPTGDYKRVVLSGKVDPDTYDAVASYAARRKISISAAVEALVKIGLAGNTKRKKKGK